MKKLYPPRAQFFVSYSCLKAPMTAPLQILLRLVIEVKDSHKAFARFFLTAAAIFIMAVQARAQTPVLTGPTMICTGTATTITASGTAPFTWYDAATGGNLLYTGAAFTTPALTANTTYWVSSNGGTRIAVNIDVPPMPSYKVVASHQSICAGSSTTLSVQPANVPISWYDAPTGGNLLGTGNLTVSPATTTVYYARFNGQPQADTVYYFYTNIARLFNQQFTVPAGVSSINIDARAPRGGYANELFDGTSYNGTPGKGGRVQATMNVTAGEVLSIQIGQSGLGEPDYQGGIVVNGGGELGATGGNLYSGTGGGAVDIRINGTGLGNRVLVAGAGGGVGADIYDETFTNGGAGGGLTGGAAADGGYSGSNGLGGSQTAGGAGGNNNLWREIFSGEPVSNGQNGALGNGGTSGELYITDTYDYLTAGGGGGGYYGGGGGTVGSGGGGGSSYTDPTVCLNVVHTQGYNNGNGVLLITYNTCGACTAVAYTLADTITVNPVLTASVAISSAVTCSTCTPQTVAFTATAVNGGTTPVYAWYKNNTHVGTNSPTYSDAALKNGDQIFCKLTASGPCFVANPVSSSTITVTQPVITSFSPSSGPVGTLVTIKGTGLVNPVSLSIGGAAAIPVSSTGSQVVAMVMPGAVTGGISVTGLLGAASDSSNFTLTTVAPLTTQQGGKMTDASSNSNLYFGSSVALSADGNTAIVGIKGDNSGTGGVTVYTRSYEVWTQQGSELLGTGASGTSGQGTSVALSADGNTALVGGPGDNISNGAVWVFVRSNGSWSQQGNKLTGSDASEASQLGYSVSVSADGNTAFTGGLGDNGNLGAGWIFNRVNGIWTQNGSKLVGTGAINTAEDYMGSSVAMSADGNTAVLGGKYDNARTGALWVFTNTNGTWTQQGNKLLASDAISSPYGPELGCSVAISADGNTIFSGGSRDNNFQGAAWVFTRSGGVWTQQGNKLLGSDVTGGAEFGDAVSLSADGNTAIVAATEDNNYTGAMWVFTRSNGAWAQQGNKMTGSGEIPFAGVPNFGQTVALSGDATTAFAGNKYDNTNIGAVWAFTPTPPPMLTSLVPSAGVLTPVFAPGYPNYIDTVSNLPASITLTPTAADLTSTITINGLPVASGSASAAIPLVEGPKNTITTVVTAADGTTTRTYTIAVFRKTSNAKLANLTISAGTLTPAFTSLTTSYTASVASTVTSITVTPTVADANATVTVNGVAILSGTTSAGLPLANGGNTILVAVTAQDGTTTRNYTIKVTRLSGNAGLSGLAISTGTLSPAFAVGKTSYAVSVSNAVTSMIITPTASGANATITVNGIAVKSGSASAAIPLKAFLNVINVVVTAQDGVITDTYTINVTRAPSNNAVLTNLSISSGPLNPSFDPGTSSYTTPDVANAVSTLTVMVVTSDSTATVKVNGIAVVSGSATVPLAVGANTIKTVVTAQDGSTTNMFTIAINRAASSNAGLAGISLSSGTLSPAFATAINTYTVTVLNSVSSIELTPVTSDGVATVTVNGAAVVSGSASAAISLAVGPNIITTVVTAQDGVATSTYTVTVTRSASTNANLSGLAISTGTLKPVFTTATTTYTVAMGSAISSVTITPTTSDAGATVSVNGTPVTSGSASSAIALAVGTNTISTVVTAADGFTQQTYTITVNKAASTNANLSALITSSGSLTPSFASTTTSYTKTVGYAVPSITFTPTTANSGATVTINGTPVIAGSPSAAIALSVGLNTITIIVTAQDGVTSQTYTIALTRSQPNTNATLSNIVPSSGTLTPVFSTTRYAYTDSVANSVTSLTLTPSCTNANAAVTVNGATVAPGSPSAAISLTTGSNIITAVVTAQDGVTTKTYNITVNRALSSNANLAGLSLSSGILNPVFDTNTYSYAAPVANNVSAVTVTPVSSDAGASITVNGSAVVSGSASAGIPLSVGPNIITVFVTSQDGTATQNYTITVNRTPPSSNAGLSNLTLNNATLTPVFATGTTAYTALVDNTIMSTTATPTTSDSSATVSVNGTPVISGTASQSIPLAVGPNTLTVVVTAQDGSTTQTYTVTITRAASSNATLSGLALSSGTLTPSFVSTTTSYTASVANTVAAITVTPKTGVPTSTVTVNGITVTSGMTSGAIPLKVGANTITTVVTAQNGTNTKTYKVTVTRAASTVATLSNLGLSAGTLSPAFATATTSYTLAVDNTVTATTATPTVTDATATVTVNSVMVNSGTASQSIPLAVGSNTITTVVTAQDGSTTKTYTVTITRAASSNATLLSLALSSGTLSPSFASTTTSYTASVANTVASITVTPKTGVPTSTVTVNGTAVTSGTASGAITLNVGSNIISTVVTAQNGTNTKTYKVTVTRAPGGADSYVPIAIGKGISVTIPIAIGTTETPQLAEDGIQVHQGISPNGDGINDFLQIDNISQYPDNKLAIMNRNGQLVYEAKGYDNSSKVFDGHSNQNGQMQLPGTYFYQLDYTAGGITKHKTGFIVLKY
jgi:gliding motility-associated-like protein